MTASAGAMGLPYAADGPYSGADRMKWQYQLFWLVFLLEFVNPFYDFLYYISNVNVVAFSKIPLLGLVAVCAFYHLQNRLLLTSASLLFGVFGIVALVYGLLSNRRVDSHFMTHVYTAVTPILAMSFGRHFARDFNPRAKAFLVRVLDVAFYLSSGTVLLYVYFYYVTHQIDHYGFGSYLPFVGAFLLARRSYVKFLIALILVVLSAKRSTTVIMLAITAIYFCPRFRVRLPRLNLKRVVTTLLVGVAVYYAFTYFLDNGYFRRFNVIATYDFADDTAMFEASGGRWTEVQGVARVLEGSPLRWAFGNGMGAHYTVMIPLPYPYTEEMHYAHFSPMGYVLVYGVIFTVLLYATIFRTVWRALPHRRTFFFLAFASLFVTSFFGATLFIDPKPWFFFGVLTALRNMQDTTPL